MAQGRCFLQACKPTVLYNARASLAKARASDPSNVTWELVVDEMYAVGWRISAWLKLVKVWASLRWSDIQAILPQELCLIEGRLTTILRRTKTSGPNRQVKELLVCVSERAYFAKPAWIKTGFDLLQFHVRYKRDYLMPRPLITGWRATGTLW